MERKDIKPKNKKMNLILKFSITLIALYAFYKLPFIIADKGFYYYNKAKGDVPQ